MAGFMDKLKVNKNEESEDVEEILNQLGLEEGDLMQEEADTWVKVSTLENSSDLDVVASELREGNLVLLNIGPMYRKNKVKLRQSISQLKGTVSDLNGDIARLSEDKVLATPSGTKIER